MTPQRSSFVVEGTGAGFKVPQLLHYTGASYLRVIATRGTMNVTSERTMRSHPLREDAHRSDALIRRDSMRGMNWISWLGGPVDPTRDAR